MAIRWHLWTISLFLRRFFKKILSLCMACIQERLLIKSGLWWRSCGIYPPLLVNAVCKQPLSLLKFEPRTHTIVLQLFSFSAFQYSWPFVIHRRCSWTLPWIQCHVLLRVHVFFHGETWLECSHESRWTWCIWRTIWQPLITHPNYR